jgi:hypothetical protein
MARGGLLDKMVGRVVTVHTDRAETPGFGILVGYDDQGVMLHISSELAEMLGKAGVPAAPSVIFIPWRIVGYVATDLEEPEEASDEPA